MPLSWSNFPTKHLILPYLNFEARCNLRACSRDDLELVDSSKFVPTKIALTELDSHMDQEKSIIRLDIDSFTIWFIGKNEKTRIERAWNEEVMEMAETKNENRVEVFRRLVNRFLKNGTFEARQLEIIMPTFEPDDHWIFKTSKFALITPVMPAAWSLNWVRKLAPGTKLKELTLECHELEGIAELPLIYDVSETLNLHTRTDLADEHLDRIKAKSLRIIAEGTTPDGVKRALERFFRDSDPDSDFIIRSNIPENFDPTLLIPEGVDYKKETHGQGIMEENVLKFPNRRILIVGFQFVRVFQEPKQRKGTYILWPF